MIAQKALRDTDVLARWGGEEFLMLLNDTTTEQANVGLERLRDMVAGAPMSASVPELRATFSAGLTAYDCAEPLDACIERADRALYAAKAAGRNRTAMAQAPAPLQHADAAPQRQSDAASIL